MNGIRAARQALAAAPSEEQETEAAGAVFHRRLVELWARARGAVPAEAEGKARAFAALLRPGAWPNNLLVAVPILLAPELMSPGALIQVALAVVVLALLSGVACGVNTLVEQARAGRGGQAAPSLSGDGAPSLREALLGLLLILLVALLLAYAITPGLAVVGVVFLAVQGCHALGARRVAVIEAALLAAALMLRLDAGAVVIGVAAGPYFLALALLLALFATLCRLRQTLAVPPGRGRRRRLDLRRRYLDVAISALLCGLVVGYVLLLAHDAAIQAAAGPWAFASAVFLLFALLRYWHLLVIEEQARDFQAMVLGDRWLALGLAGWLLTVVVTLHVL